MTKKAFDKKGRILKNAGHVAGAPLRRQTLAGFRERFFGLAGGYCEQQTQGRNHTYENPQKLRCLCSASLVALFAVTTQTTMGQASDGLLPLNYRGEVIRVPSYIIDRYLRAGATGDGFGQNDTLIAGDRTRNIAARIASIVIKGTATGSAAEGDHFAITAQSIGKLSIDGENIALNKKKRDNILLDPNVPDGEIVALA